MATPDIVDTSSSEVVEFLKAQHVQILVNLTHAYRDPVFEKEFLVLNMPVPNMCAPTKSGMDEILNAYLRLSEQGAMAINCLGGYGRTGTALACILVKAVGLAPKQAISRIRHCRPGSIETEEQEEFIAQYTDSSVADSGEPMRRI